MARKPLDPDILHVFKPLQKLDKNNFCTIACIYHRFLTDKKLNCGKGRFQLLSLK